LTNLSLSSFSIGTNGGPCQINFTSSATPSGAQYGAAGVLTLEAGYVVLAPGVGFYSSYQPNPVGNPGWWAIAAKSFVIDHPIHKEKYLVHTCLEGPEAGVYYRGKGEITNNYSTIIKIPDYVDKFARDFSIQITPIFNKKTKKITTCNVGEVEDNTFEVFGENCSFYWLLFASRGDVEVEPNKADVELHGDGPYTYLTKKN
jgi:hypothetical protein